MSIMDTPPPNMESPENTEVINLGEGRDPVQENTDLNPVVSWVQQRFYRARDKRRLDETRWLNSYRNYRGKYGPEVIFSEEEQSQVFVKITKTKVLAAIAQIGDVLFAGNKFPIGIEPTPEPISNVPEKVSADLGPTGGQKPQGVTATVVRPELLNTKLKTQLDPIKDKLQEDLAPTPTTVTWEPLKIAAKKMEKKIYDQLEESDASKHLRQMAFEMALFGTGIVKGPFAIDKEYPHWEKKQDETTQQLKTTYAPVVKTIPKINSVSVWNFYPDPDAHSMNECEGVVERHKMSSHDLRQLKKRPMFRKESIEEAIRRGWNYHPEDWETVLEDGGQSNNVERYEVLEYWGTIDRKIAEDNGLVVPESKMDSDVDEFQVNIWICNDQILRLVINPYTPSIIPYYATPYEVNPYSFFGIGVAENMEDTQELMNGFMRMAVDNAALSGNILIEVDETNLVPGQDMKVYPGKIFRRQAGAPGQAIFGTKFPNVSNEMMQLFDKARQLSDEATNMPSYSHGGTGVPGVGRTAAGMSMLMGAAAQSIKAVVRNIDDYFLNPLGKNLFAFNMQFDPDPEIEGDLAVVAKGTESLMRNEVRSQRLLQFMQVGLGNPVTAPLVRVDYILRELATSLDLDEDLVVNDPRAMMIQAELMKQMNAIMNPGGQGQPQSNGPNGAPPVKDETGTGNGNIAPGNAPEPGVQGNTGSGGGNNGGQTSTKADSAKA